MAILVGGESARRSDQCENGGLDWSGEICPSRDDLRQFGTGSDWISGVYSGVSVRFPFIRGQNIGVRIPLSPPVFSHRFALDSTGLFEFLLFSTVCPSSTLFLRVFCTLLSFFERYGLVEAGSHLCSILAGRLADQPFENDAHVFGVLKS